MTRGLLCVVLVLVLLACCIAVHADLPAVGQANAVLGQGKATLGVSLSLPLGQWHARSVTGTWYADGLYSQGQFGGGVSTDVAPIADLLGADEWLYPALPFVAPILERIAVGTCVMWEGDAKRMDGGVYCRLSLKEWKF